MRVCVITDNEFIFTHFTSMIEEIKYEEYDFDFYYSSWNKAFCDKFCNERFQAINLKKQNEDFFTKYDLFISLHCKQIFPANLVNNHRCINVHPGYNPENRGWYPQVFSILNKKAVGVTIHEMDELLDHGPIIVQEKVSINSWDTSFDVYNKIQNLEIQLLREYLPIILEGNYNTKLPKSEGNINYARDFESICELKLDEQITWEKAIDILRALSFNGYKNAYFYDNEGNKVYVDIQLQKDE